jgi:alcohol dehydrogenase
VSDEQMVMLADILPTSYEVGVLNGTVHPGDVVAIIGTEPIGLAAVLTARLFSPQHIVAIDIADSRLEAARKFGADITVNSASDDPRAVVDEITASLGADVAMEAVGIPSAFDDAVRLVRPGGHVANIGVHGAPVTLQQIDTSPMITHRFGFDEFDSAYAVFSRPADTGALKVLLTAAH